MKSTTRVHTTDWKTAVCGGHKKWKLIQLLAKNQNSLWTDINFGIPQTFIRIENILFTLHAVTFACSHVHTGYGQHLVMVCRTHPCHCRTTLFPAIVFFTLVFNNKPRMEYVTQSVADFLSPGPVSQRQQNLGQATWIWEACLCAGVCRRMQSCRAEQTCKCDWCYCFGVLSVHQCVTVDTLMGTWCLWYSEWRGFGDWIGAMCASRLNGQGHCYCELQRAPF